VVSFFCIVKKDAWYLQANYMVWAEFSRDLLAKWLLSCCCKNFGCICVPYSLVGTNRNLCFLLMLIFEKIAINVAKKIPYMNLVIGV